MQPYKKIKRWDYGEVITPQKLNEMSDALQAFTEEIHNATSEIQERYDENGNAINQKLADKLSLLASMVQINSKQHLKQYVEEYSIETLTQVSNLSARLTTEISSMNSTLNNAISNMNNTLNSSISDMNNTIDTEINTVNTSIDNKINVVNNNIAVINDSIDSKISAVNDSIDSKITAKVGDASFVSYSTNQNLGTSAQRTARSNIKAAFSEDVVTDVKIENSQLAVTKNGTTTRTHVNVDGSGGGQSFDSGAVIKETAGANAGKQYLHLYKTTQGEEPGQEIKTDIPNFRPIEMPDAALPFNTFECKEEEQNGATVYKVYAKMGDEYLSSDIFEPFQIIGGGGGGGVLISLNNVYADSRIRNGHDANISFTVITNDSSPVMVEWFVNGEKKTVATEYASGRNVSFNAKGMLIDSDSNEVSVRLTSGPSVKIRTWTIISVDFSVAWASTVDEIMLHDKDEDMTVLVNVFAPALMDNILTLQVNSNTPKTQTVSGTVFNRSFVINKNQLIAGKNTIKCYLVNGTNSADWSNVISFTILNVIGASTPIISFGSSSIDTEQYKTTLIPYFAYTPDKDQTTVSITVSNTGVTETYTAGKHIEQFEYTPLEDGTFTITLQTTYKDINNIDRTLSTTITVNVSQTTANIVPVSGDTRVYVLDPTGHSNSEKNREEFGSYQNNKIIFDNKINQEDEDTFDWSNGGFQKDGQVTAFVVKKGHRITLPLSLFQFSEATGKTIDLNFKITNSDDYFATALVDLSKNGNNGLKLKSNQGELYLGTSVPKTFNYCENERIDMSINVEKTGATNRLFTVWLDGIPSYVSKYVANSLTPTPSNTAFTVIGSDHCDIWIYNIRIYNESLSQDSMIRNYVSNGINLDDKLKRADESDIFFTQNPTTVQSNGEIFYSHYEILPDKLHAARPDLTIITLEIPRMTTGKEDNVPANVTIQDGDDKLILPASEYSDSESINGCVIKVQGTTSVYYGRSSYNLDIDFKKCQGKPKYKISNNSIPVNYLNIKVNVASSENANNICAVDWYNTNQPWKIQARKANSNIRDVMEGKPCAVFIKNTSGTAQWFSSQLVQPGKTILYAMGDLCNSKKNYAVFGEDGTVDNPTKCCIEISDNTSEQQCFRATANYEGNRDDGKGEWGHYEAGAWVKDYEWRWRPDQNADVNNCVNAWNQTVAWLVSVKNDPAAFKANFENYFTKQSMLYHFLMAEYFLAIDNISKNTFYSFDYQSDATDRGTIGSGDTAADWGKYRWNIVKAYDWDTILACDNEGAPFGDYGIDYGDLKDGTSGFDSGNIYAIDTDNAYYKAMNSIWVNIRQAYNDDLCNLYGRLRNDGAWDANAIALKWNTYQAKRPHAAMIRDAYVKYIYPVKTTGVALGTNTGLGYDDSYLKRLNGSKIYQRKQFLTYQTSYMDGKYKYFSDTGSIIFRTNSANNVTVKVKSYAKTYIGLKIGNTEPRFDKVETGNQATFGPLVFGGNNTTIYVNPGSLIQYIKPINESGINSFANSSAFKLTQAILGHDTTENSAWEPTNSLTIVSPILKVLNIKNLVRFNYGLDLSNQEELTDLNTQNTNATAIQLCPYAPLHTIYLNKCSEFYANNITMAGEVATRVCEIEGVDRLTKLMLNDCSPLIYNEFKNKMIKYLTDNKSGNDYPDLPLTHARLTNITWYITDEQLFLLDKLLKVKGIDSNGALLDNSACILTGKIYIRSATNSDQPGDVSTVKLHEYESAWNTKDLQIICNRVEQFTITFYSWDGVNTLIPPKIVNFGYVMVASDFPTSAQVDRDPDQQYRYEWEGAWEGLPNGYDQPGIGVQSNIYARPIYTKIPQLYTVTWYSDSSKSLIAYQVSNATYGSSQEYGGVPLTKTDTNYVYIFKGWDKSTGFITGDTQVIGQWDISAKTWTYNNYFQNPSENSYTFSLPAPLNNKRFYCIRQTPNLAFSAADIKALSEMAPATAQEILTNLNAENSKINVILGYDCDYNSTSSTLQPGQIKSYDLLDQPLEVTSETVPVQIGSNIFNFFHGKSFTLLIDFSAFGEFRLSEAGDLGSLLYCAYKDSNNKEHGFQLAMGYSQSNTEKYRRLCVFMWDGDGNTITRYMRYAQHNRIVIRYNHLTEQLTLFVRGNMSTSAIDDTFTWPRDYSDSEAKKDCTIATNQSCTIPYNSTGAKLYIGGYVKDGQNKGKLRAYIRTVKLWEGVLSSTDCGNLVKYLRWNLNFKYVGYGLYDHSNNEKTKLSFISDSFVKYGGTGLSDGSYSGYTYPEFIESMFNSYWKNAFPIEWQALFTSINNALAPISGYNYTGMNLFVYSLLRYDVITRDATTPRITLIRDPNPKYPADEDWDQTRMPTIKEHSMSTTGTSYVLNSYQSYLGSIMRTGFPVRLDELGKNLYYCSNKYSSTSMSFKNTFNKLYNNNPVPLKTGDIIWLYSNVQNVSDTLPPNTMYTFIESSDMQYYKEHYYLCIGAIREELAAYNGYFIPSETIELLNESYPLNNYIYSIGDEGLISSTQSNSGNSTEIPFCTNTMLGFSVGSYSTN